MENKRWSEIGKIGACGVPASEAVRKLKEAALSIQELQTNCSKMNNSIKLIGNCSFGIEGLMLQIPRGYQFSLMPIVKENFRRLGKVEMAKARYRYITGNAISDSDISELSEKANSLPGQSLRTFVNLVNNKAYEDAESKIVGIDPSMHFEVREYAPLFIERDVKPHHARKTKRYF